MSRCCSCELSGGSSTLCLLDQADLVAPPPYGAILYQDICRFRARRKHAGKDVARGTGCACKKSKRGE